MHGRRESLGTRLESLSYSHSQWNARHLTVDVQSTLQLEEVPTLLHTPQTTTRITDYTNHGLQKNSDYKMKQYLSLNSLHVQYMYILCMYF